MLSSVLDSEEDINIITNRFLKKLNGCIAMSFRKVRINHMEDKSEKVHQKLRNLKNLEDTKSKKERQEVLKAIVSESENNFLKLKEEVAK